MLTLKAQTVELVKLKQLFIASEVNLLTDQERQPRK